MQRRRSELPAAFLPAFAARAKDFANVWQISPIFAKDWQLAMQQRPRLQARPHKAEFGWDFRILTHLKL
jgi:hypothetical protein